MNFFTQNGWLAHLNGLLSIWGKEMPFLKLDILLKGIKIITKLLASDVLMMQYQFIEISRRIENSLSQDENPSGGCVLIETIY